MARYDDASAPLEVQDQQSIAPDGLAHIGPPLYPRARLEPRWIIVALLLLAPVLTLVAFAFLGLIGDSSPQGALYEYVDALNDRDVKRMFDQTVTSLSPDYEELLPYLGSIVFVLDPKVTIHSAERIDLEDMSDIQRMRSQDTVEEIESRYEVTVDDYCIVACEYTMVYRTTGDEATFQPEIVCVKIGGTWYLALPGYF